MSQASKSISSLLEQWQRERPDIDSRPMAVCGQVWRTADRLRKQVAKNQAKYDMDSARSDVLFTLRRQGKGSHLSPSELAAEMMLSTSAMTNRLDRLEQKGLIKRLADPNDRRGLKISLTDKGFALADEMVVTHVKIEADMLKNLTQSEQQTLISLLAKIA
ncbi:MAG: MarR family transcriptional regulator [Hyphomicrobiales bacterium]|nr:MAG: MarR family transcriptional regulator [Hyphomicrobiales bacterium]